MAKDGLTGVNAFVEKLIDSLYQNVDLKEVMEVRLAKYKIEQMWFNKKTDSKEFALVVEVARSDPEIKLLKFLIKNKKKIQRTVGVLTKIYSSERYKKVKDVETVLELFRVIEQKGILKWLLRVIKAEKSNLKNNKIEQFLTMYQKDKAIALDLTREIKKLGMQKEFSEIVRAGFSKKGLRTHYISFIQDYGPVWGNLILINAIILPLVFPPLQQGIINYFVASTVLKFLVPKFSKGKQNTEHNSKTEPLVDLGHKNSLEKKYDIKIEGVWTNQILQYIDEALSIHKPEETRVFLKKIIITNEPLKKSSSSKTVGQYSSLTKTIHAYADYSIRETIFHEVAHGRDVALPKNIIGAQYNFGLIARFKTINKRYGVPIRKVKKQVKKGTEYQEWIDDYSKPKYGYARPYGTKNINEDIATMTEFISKLAIATYGVIVGYSSENIKKYNAFVHYTKVYLLKAEALYQFGLISKQDLETFKEKIQNTINAERIYKKSEPYIDYGI